MFRLADQTGWNPPGQIAFAQIGAIGAIFELPPFRRSGKCLDVDEFQNAAILDIDNNRPNKRIHIVPGHFGSLLLGNIPFSIL